jgi:hypothetical protein
MKKSLIIGILGLAAGVATSYGQGYVVFNTYAANNSNSYFTTYGNGPSVGALVPGTFTGELLYSLSSISDTASTASGALTAGWTVGPTGTFGDTAVPGTVTGPDLFLPTYVAGTTIWFEFAAFSGASYGASLVPGQYAGHSASFSQQMATGLTLPWVADGMPGAANGNGSGLISGWNVFTPVPEPTTMALAGLGGLALLLFRRKQA